MLGTASRYRRLQGDDGEGKKGDDGRGKKGHDFTKRRDMSHELRKTLGQPHKTQNTYANDGLRHWNRTYPLSQTLWARNTIEISH
jgi:hypothetical protein